MIGTMGIGIQHEEKEEEVGRFNRTLPPKTTVEYDPRWELGLEVMRWFHYRYEQYVSHEVIDSVPRLVEVMTNGYHKYLAHKFPKKMWDTIKLTVVEPRIREFCEVFKDVLAEIEITREAR